MLHFNFMDQIPEEMTGGKRPGDDQYALITGRRSVFESVVAAFADECDHSTVRRATAVEDLCQCDGAASPEPTGAELPVLCHTSQE